MNISLSRRHSNAFCVVGVFTYDGCADTIWSMELPLTFNGAENVPDETCIPAGSYKVEDLYSAHFNRLCPHLVGVPGRTEIEIHPASRPSDLKGCCAIGDVWLTQNPVTADDVIISGSQDAYGKFYKAFAEAVERGEAMTMTITNDF
jgi:hypothetical protein